MRYLLLLLALLAAACHRPEPLLRKLDDAAMLPAFDDQADLQSLHESLNYQISYLENRKLKRGVDSLQVDGVDVSVAELLDLYRSLDHYILSDPAPSKTELEAWLRERAVWYAVVGRTRDGKILVTSYYVPEYHASLTRTERFTYPLYAPPADMKNAGTPYLTREQIDYENALDGRSTPIAWLDNDIDRFFLHVQGSGALSLEDGTNICVGYAADNGHPYVSLGRLLIDDGKVPPEKMSMSGIREYFTERPEALRDYMRRLPRYIFFAVKPAATGSMGFPVVPMRSIAVDPTRIPYGLFSYLETRRPRFDDAGTLVDYEPMSLLVLPQDTGGGIKGDHIDLFWGIGDDAARHAGVMKERANLYLLLPKPSRLW